MGWSDLSPLLEVLEQRCCTNPYLLWLRAVRRNTRTLGCSGTVQPLAGMSFRLYLLLCLLVYLVNLFSFLFSIFHPLMPVVSGNCLSITVYLPCLPLTDPGIFPGAAEAMSGSGHPQTSPCVSFSPYLGLPSCFSAG